MPTARSSLYILHFSFNHVLLSVVEIDTRLSRLRGKAMALKREPCSVAVADGIRIVGHDSFDSSRIDDEWDVGDTRFGCIKRFHIVGSECSVVDEELVEVDVSCAVAVTLTDAEVLGRSKEVKHLLVVEIGSTSTFGRNKRSDTLGLVDIDFHAIGLVDSDGDEFPLTHFECVALHIWIVDGKSIYAVSETEVGVACK